MRLTAECPLVYTAHGAALIKDIIPKKVKLYNARGNPRALRQTCIKRMFKGSVSVLLKAAGRDLDRKCLRPAEITLAS